MRPFVKMLSDADVDIIIDGALDVFAKVGVHIGSRRVLKMVCEENGAELQADRALLDRVIVEKCLKLAPSEIKIFPQDSAEPLVLADDRFILWPGRWFRIYTMNWSGDCGNLLQMI